MDEKTAKVVYETVRESVFTQFRNIANIDTKISVVIGFNALVLILGWQLYPHVQHTLFFSGVGLLMLSLLLLIIAYSNKDWYNSPNPQSLVKRLKEGKEIKQMYLQTIRNIAGKDDAGNKKNDLKTLGAYGANKRRINRKNNLLVVSMYILFAALVAIGLSRILFRSFLL